MSNNKAAKASISTIEARVIVNNKDKEGPTHVEVTLPGGKSFRISTGPAGKSPAVQIRDLLHGRAYSYKMPSVPAETLAITFEWTVVTPEMALEMLSQGIEDRRVHMNRVNRYAAIISRDGWLPVTDSITFDKTGKRLNGQHRLLAIAISGIPTVMLVARNVPKKAQKGYDQGLSRGAADWIQHKYPMVPKKEVTSPVLRNIMLVAAGGVGNQYNPDTAEVIAGMYEKDLIWLRNILTKDKEVNEVPLFKDSNVRTGLVIARHFLPKMTNDLVAAVIDGTNLRQGTASRVFKDWLSNIRGKKLNGMEKIYAVLRAVQAYAANESLGKSIPKASADVVESFTDNRRKLIPEGTYLPEFGKRGGDPETRNRNGVDPRDK